MYAKYLWVVALYSASCSMMPKGGDTSKIDYAKQDSQAQAFQKFSVASGKVSELRNRLKNAKQSKKVDLAEQGKNFATDHHAACGDNPKMHVIVSLSGKLGVDVSKLIDNFGSREVVEELLGTAIGIKNQDQVFKNGEKSLLDVKEPITHKLNFCSPAGSTNKIYGWVIDKNFIPKDYKAPDNEFTFELSESEIKSFGANKEKTLVIGLNYVDNGVRYLGFPPVLQQAVAMQDGKQTDKYIIGRDQDDTYTKQIIIEIPKPSKQKFEGNAFLYAAQENIDFMGPIETFFDEEDGYAGKVTGKVFAEKNDITKFYTDQESVEKAVVLQNNAGEGNTKEASGNVFAEIIEDSIPEILIPDEEGKIVDVKATEDNHKNTTEINGSSSQGKISKNNSGSTASAPSNQPPTTSTHNKDLNKNAEIESKEKKNAIPQAFPLYTLKKLNKVSSANLTSWEKKNLGKIFLPEENGYTSVSSIRKKCAGKEIQAVIPISDRAKPSKNFLNNKEKIRDVLEKSLMGKNPNRPIEIAVKKVVSGIFSKIVDTVDHQRWISHIAVVCGNKTPDSKTPGTGTIDVATSEIFINTLAFNDNEDYQKEYFNDYHQDYSLSYLSDEDLRDSLGEKIDHFFKAKSNRSKIVYYENEGKLTLGLRLVAQREFTGNTLAKHLDLDWVTRISLNQRMESNLMTTIGISIAAELSPSGKLTTRYLPFALNAYRQVPWHYETSRRTWVLNNPTRKTVNGDPMLGPAIDESGAITIDPETGKQAIGELKFFNLVANNLDISPRDGYPTAYIRFSGDFNEIEFDQFEDSSQYALAVDKDYQPQQEIASK